MTFGWGRGGWRKSEEEEEEERRDGSKWEK